MTGFVEPVLLLSPDGMLGHAWHLLLERESVSFEEVSYPEFDLTDRESTARAVDDRFKTVINCSAYTDVDGAETDEETARAINGTGIGVLAELCGRSEALLVHYSTDYVFNGDAHRPYSTDHPLDPVNAYGRSKALGEERIRAAGDKHLIIRTSWLYAPWAKNFVRTMARLCQEREVLKVVDDQRGRPSSAEQLAQSSQRLLARGGRGTFHLTDGGECTWYDFARAIADQVGATCRIEPCSTEEFPRPAKRPRYSVLDLTASEALAGPLPPWQQCLASVLQQMA